MRPSTRMVVLGGKKLLTPAALGSSLALWLDAADISTITLNGSTVSQWNDKSGNNRHIAQATQASQPLYDATGLTNRATIKFDGVDDHITANSTAAAIGNNDFLFFLVIRFPTINANIIAILRESSGSLMRGYFTRSGATNFSTTWGDPSVFTSSIPGLNGGNIVGAQRIGSNVQAFCNGTSSTTVNATFSNSYSTLMLGAFTSTLQFSDTWYSEIIVGIGTFSLDTIQQIEGYLAHKWGLAANLPGNHPFRFTPPLA